MHGGIVIAAPIYRSKADAAYVELRRRILDGSLPPSMVLNQEQVAADLGLSTTPLREALRRLESEGFVEMPPHRDVSVAPLHARELVAVYEVREHLDPLGARLAARNHDDVDRKRMEQAAARLKRGTGDAVANNRAFHAAVYKSSHNDILIGLLDGLWDRAERYRRVIRGIARKPDVVADHLRILETVVDRDEDEAERLMRAHVAIAHELIKSVLVGGTSEREVDLGALVSSSDRTRGS